MRVSVKRGLTELTFILCSPSSRDLFALEGFSPKESEDCLRNKNKCGF